MKFISKRRPIPAMTSAMIQVTPDIAKRDQNGVVMIRQRVWEVVAVILLVCGLQLFCGLRLYAQQADLGVQAGHFITFDPPGSQSTNPAGMNLEGTITGTYFDASGAHGFLRAAGGTFTTVDAPGSVSPGTFANAINSVGTVTGIYFTQASFLGHGFLRVFDGSITAFDPPGSVGTETSGINDEGAITGYYFDAGFHFHGFLRARDGTFTTFDPVGSTGTFGIAINPAGVIMGQYDDATFALHGFLAGPRR